MGCVDVLASNDKYNCFFSCTIYHLSDRSLARGLVPAQTAVLCDFAGFLLRVWHQVNWRQRLLFQRNHHGWGVQVLCIHIPSPHPLKCCLKISPQVTSRKRETKSDRGEGAGLRFMRKISSMLVSCSCCTYSGTGSGLACFHRQPVSYMHKNAVSQNLIQNMQVWMRL